MSLQLNPMLLLFQSDAGQTMAADPNQSLNSWLVIAGIVLIFCCLAALLLPNIKELITRPQEFNFSKLGVSMRISILTVFVLMGFILSLSSFALQWRGYVQQASESAKKVAELNGTIKQLQTTISEHQAAEVSRRTFSMSILLKPELDEEVPLNESDWSCTYWLYNEGKPSDPVHPQIRVARNGTYFRVFLNDIKLDTRIYYLELRRGSQFWTAENLSPLSEGIWEAQLLRGGNHD